MLLCNIIERRCGGRWRLTIGHDIEYVVCVDVGNVTLRTHGSTLAEAEANATRDIEAWFAGDGEDRDSLVALLRASIALVHRQGGEAPVRLVRDK